MCELQSTYAQKAYEQARRQALIAHYRQRYGLNFLGLRGGKAVILGPSRIPKLKRGTA